jgi:hypothetical protein
MKTNFIVSILILFLAFPILASGPLGGGGGGPMERPSWWQGDWPPKNWGQFESDWRHNAPPGTPFPCQGSECDSLKDWIKGKSDFSITPSMTLYQAPAPVKYDSKEEAKSDQASAKNEEAARCGNCFKISFTAVPTGGLDYDRNRYIIYLGSDEVLDDETISKKTGTMVGPFGVIENGIFTADIGVKGVFGFGHIGSINIGLKLNGSAGYESSRIATTLDEAKNMKRLKSIPRTFKDLMELPLGTIVVSKLSGGIAFEASVVAGYVATAGTEFGADGEWMVRVAKPNNYEAVVSITDVKTKQVTLSAGVALPSVSLKKSWSNKIFFSFQINLTTPEGIAAYEDFFRGKIISVQHAARRNPKLIRQLKSDQFDNEIYKPLTESSSKVKSTIKSAGVGFPFIGSASINLGSESYVTEELRFLSAQDITQLGAVKKGTMLHTFRGSYSTGKNTAGLASTHRERLKEFNVKLEDIIIPNDYLNESPLEGEKVIKGPPQALTPSGYRRIISSFEYKFHKNKWTKKDWEEEIKFMARRTGFKDELIKNMPNPIKENTVNFAEFQATLKISEKALRALAGKVFLTGEKAYYDRVSKLAQFNLEKWFSDPENEKYEQCDNLIACKSRISSHTEESVKTAIEGLKNVSILFKKLERENNDKAKKELVKAIMKFGSAMVKNQFTVGIFLQELATNRMNNKENDFAYCFQWKGSTFRQNQFVLVPSGLRTDRNECYLKEETEVDEVAKKNDRDLFGSEFILD